MKKTISNVLLILAASAPTVWASHDVGVGGFSVQGKVEEPGRQLAEGETMDITMRCFAAEGGHRITLVASNPGKSRHLCQSRCYYRTNSGLTGVMYGSGFVPPGADNIEVRTDYFNDFEVSITHPGSFACR
jgi:hypothetical protein